MAELAAEHRFGFLRLINTINTLDLGHKNKIPSVSHTILSPYSDSVNTLPTATQTST